jgi:uncharacterized protein
LTDAPHRLRAVTAPADPPPLRPRRAAAATALAPRRALTTMPSTITLEHLRRHAVARSLFKPTTLGRAITKLGFVQADPIRAPARAQDLILRHRVAGYLAGDLERRYARLPIEEDFFVNHGFLPRATQALMHPRTPRTVWPAARRALAATVLDWVQQQGTVHPSEVDAHFQQGRSTNWFGGSSRASTQLLDEMQYRGLLRIAGRAAGVRLYAARGPGSSAAAEVDQATVLDTLVDVVVGKYAPLPQRSLAELVNHLRGGVPQWADGRRAALQRALARLPQALVGGEAWLWPAGENPASSRHAIDDSVRLLAPFDPVVWDRRRFERLWGWAYRFEAYTPAPRRVRGYYALPLLWRGQVIGWGNLKVAGGVLEAGLGFVAGRPPRDAAWRSERDAELSRMAVFLGVGAFVQR